MKFLRFLGIAVLNTILWVILIGLCVTLVFWGFPKIVSKLIGWFI